MAMVEESLPVPTPTRFVLECGGSFPIPDFGSLEINPFEFSFTKNLPATPSPGIFKTPDSISIFKYVTSTHPPHSHSQHPHSSQPHSHSQPSSSSLSSQQQQPPPPSTQSPPSSDYDMDESRDEQTMAQVVYERVPQEPRDASSSSPSTTTTTTITTTTTATKTTSASSPDRQPRDHVMSPQPLDQEDQIVMDPPKPPAPSVRDLSAKLSYVSDDSPLRKQPTISSDWQEYDHFDRAGSMDSDDSSTSSLGHNKRKLSMTEDTEDQEQKRRKFLERNRMAASKCRQKKKMWMQELEQRSDEVIQRNKALHTLVSQLKEEVLILKNQLLSHHNCNCNVIQQYVQTSGHFNMSLMNSLHPQVSSMPPQVAGIHPQHPQHMLPPRELMFAQ